MVLAGSEAEALQLLHKEGRWNNDDLVAINPQVLRADKPTVLGHFIR